MGILEARHSWSGTAGLASASQLVNGTIVRQVSTPNQSTGNTASRLTIFLAAKPSENLHRTETIKTLTAQKGGRISTKKRKSKSR